MGVEDCVSGCGGLCEWYEVHVSYVASGEKYCLVCWK